MKPLKAATPSCKNATPTGPASRIISNEYLPGTSHRYTIRGHRPRRIERPEITDPHRGHPDAIAVVRTSGSTGTPKQTLLTRAALQASATATADYLGGQGQWLLALGTQYVAGLAVVSRSVQAGTKPVVIDPG